MVNKMGYITTSEAAKKWNLDKKKVIKLCETGKVVNALFISEEWFIPSDFSFDTKKTNNLFDFFKNIKINKRHIYYALIFIIIFLLGFGIFKVHSSKTMEATSSAVIESSSSEESSAASREVSPIAYENLYPDMYCDAPVNQKSTDHVIYLAFDDGPSDITNQVLDILKQNNVKATFFVIGNESEKHPDIIKRIVDEGHTIGVHTYCHQYDVIYASVESYLEDFYKTYDFIYKTTGVKPEIFRFPGGSVNNANKNTRDQIIAEMRRRGFTFYDWNVYAEDAVGGLASTDKIISSITDNLIKNGESITLIHDSQVKTTLPAAIQPIIDYGRANGYTFDRLTKEVKPVTMYH